MICNQIVVHSLLANNHHCTNILQYILLSLLVTPSIYYVKLRNSTFLFRRYEYRRTVVKELCDGPYFMTTNYELKTMITIQTTCYSALRTATV